MDNQKQNKKPQKTPRCQPQDKKQNQNNKHDCQNSANDFESKQFDRYE